MENIDFYSRYEVICINYMELLLLVLDNEVEKPVLLQCNNTLYYAQCYYNATIS